MESVNEQIIPTVIIGEKTFQPKKKPDVKLQEEADERLRIYLLKVRAPTIPVIKVTSNQFLALMVKAGNELYENFVLDDDNRLAFELFSQYFTSDDNFKNSGFSLKKGICLSGNMGTGKTTVFNLAYSTLSKLKSPKIFRIVQVLELISIFSQSGFQVFKNFGTTYRLNHTNNSPNTNEPIPILIDDAGTEADKCHYYGNSINVLGDLITERYTHIHEGMILHMTTNLNPQELGQKYGKRVLDRLREMCNFMVLEGNSRRK